MKVIIKRNGSQELYNSDKIINAISNANKSVNDKDKISNKQILKIEKYIRNINTKSKYPLEVEHIQDLIEMEIMKLKKYKLAKNYITYRYDRNMNRNKSSFDDAILNLINNNNEVIKEENSNKNPTINSVQRDYMAGEISKDISERLLLSDDIIKANKEGILHFHDLDYYAQRMHNCDLVNLEDMLQNGTVINGTMIEKPKSFSTACNIATQIMAQVASSQYGGQSISLTHLAPFVDITRKKIKKEINDEFKLLNTDIDNKIKKQIIEDRVKRDIAKGVQTMQYQINTLMTTNGQAPFVTLFMYLNEAKSEKEKSDLALIIEEVINQRFLGTKNEKGFYVTPAFPKLVYVLEEDNITEKSKYWYLTKLAAKCTAKRLVPDYISEKKMLEYKIDKNGEGHCYTPMGCRSFLTPYVDKNNEPKYYGRFNQGVVTINLVDVALSANKNLNKFWDILDERLELCHKALRFRHERLLGTSSNVAPILWQNGALARLEKDEKIDKLLYGGYSTLSLGYAGLWECVYALNGKKLTELPGEKLGLKIMEKLNEYTNKWKKAENIDYSIYGTPLESTTYKFAKCLQKRFGIIKGITDKNYITNSYHVHVTEKINAFDKLLLESKFQKLSPGGAISYVEVPNMMNNIEGVLSIIKFIYEHIMYAEINIKSDFCQCCNYNGEIEIIEDENGKLIWRCPNCGNTNQNKMNVARRTCGYIGSQFWNQGRTQEIKERVTHVD